ncbi:hypothetical protein HRW23_11765 [Streptomyces lunaelactis]|uniref:hypothetical protein n=1 Tax=Streptomyces lunaelactis TaxID=1535768 RepID=UPI001584C0BC|nr:hypothetical protein [Streptomyces lunaelactis]NUK04905.1 hypothetical protein [Streptomyces lunaelactis]NUK12713.1 hypothetical protein [Streptomyces lunaelactis]NUK19503.1 hypothetical protein [Streptomyces lunaelactis]NUK26697.1 hypothetical protein [Streptomyces lunaelactis]NUK37646.1 hypothetical protein [Streptomyces lunaelactis]
MSDDTWDALKATPITEIRRRAAIINKIVDVPSMTVDGAERFAWNDSGGQSAVWYFTPDSRVMLLTFDHETALNLYAEGTYAAQESLYGEVPEDLVQLVRNRPENYESLNLTDPETDETIHYAGGVFWFDGEQWWAAEGFLDHCDQEGLDPMIESGFSYCLDDYMFGQEFTAEAFIEHRDADSWYDSAAEKDDALAAVREIFTRHG